MKVAKRHVQRLRMMLAERERVEAQLQATYGPRRSGTPRAIRVREAEAIRAVLAALDSAGTKGGSGGAGG